MTVSLQASQSLFLHEQCLLRIHGNAAGKGWVLVQDDLQVCQPNLYADLHSIAFVLPNPREFAGHGISRDSLSILGVRHGKWPVSLVRQGTFLCLVQKGFSAIGMLLDSLLLPLASPPLSLVLYWLFAKVQ
jgi:hypothetical protein